MATNQKVGGSSPSWRATSEQSPLCSDVFFCLRHKKPPGASLPCSSFPQKVSFAPAAPLQARSPRLRCTTNFLRTGASLLKRCTQFAIIASAVVANFFARAEALTGELRFCGAKWEFLKLPSNFSGESPERSAGDLPSPEKGLARLAYSLASGLGPLWGPFKTDRGGSRDLTTLRLATDFLRKRARAFLCFVSSYRACLYRHPNPKTGRHLAVSAGFFFFPVHSSLFPVLPGPFKGRLNYSLK